MKIWAKLLKIFCTFCFLVLYVNWIIMTFHWHKLQELIKFDQRDKFWPVLADYYNEMKLFTLANQYHLVLTRTRIRKLCKNRNMAQLKLYVKFELRPINHYWGELRWSPDKYWDYYVIFEKGPLSRISTINSKTIFKLLPDSIKDDVVWSKQAENLYHWAHADVSQVGLDLIAVGMTPA